MKYFACLILGVLFSSSVLHARCEVPFELKNVVSKSSVAQLRTKSRDVERNSALLSSLCLYTVNFKEHKYRWKMLLITHGRVAKGAFWFLPHDDENTAFDTAVYAVNKYGGGFLAVMSDDKRYYKGQDPNRNFGETKHTAKTCKKQHYSAPKYSKTVFKVIDTFRSEGMPYLALHNNKDGWYKNGGSGTVSILKSSSIVQSYLAHKDVDKHDIGLRDEDSLVYIAGKKTKPNEKKLQQLLRRGLHVKYEIIDKKNNDCSLSNYVVLTKGTEAYYNLEAEHKDFSTQKIMLDKMMQLLR